MKKKTAKLTGAELLAALGQATSGLLFPSESDAPFTPYRWEGAAGAPLGPETLLASLGLPATTPVETTTLEDTLGPFTELSEHPSPEDETDAQHFRSIITALEQALADVRVYRVGKVDIDVYLLGRHPSGEWLGLKTHAVET
ncbi:MAG: nuclease A inhibitor family protein [Minicystis sp.]